MAKNETAVPRLIWHLSKDGMRPIRAPHWFVGRNPFERTVLPESSINVELCVSANCALLAFPVESHQGDATIPSVIAAGQEVIVTVTNRSKHMAMSIADGEGLVKLVPLLLSPNLEVEFE